MNTQGIMPTNSPYSYFSRRTMGRASSPPTWACYEQIPYDDEDEDYSDSEDESCSEDDEDYAKLAPEPLSDTDHVVSERQDDTQNMEINDVDPSEKDKICAEYKKDIKGKQRAVEPEVEVHKKHRHQKRHHHRPVYTLRPILTIQKSQGFVWNQDLFVPPYIKDRYIASTSPPNSKGFISNSWTSTTSSLTDYEVEVVEIRVGDGELSDIIP
ncbi:hypothetical protein BJ138DRAFT_933943 [Hygrophoropsis aurantiaca]|uniref:Uncharacterized protein n=1 Tax=Hygrophoropsis aurantiaca TaxID=72124 RepID=A0ACB8AE12_9AGAM|nr:hypothetical protein BJ138DRAFT_933943 [Hygrophoropsis aurantiaca]